jgi:hypothetical protein
MNNGPKRLFEMTIQQCLDSARMARIAGLEHWEVKYLEQADILRRIAAGFTAQREGK